MVVKELITRWGFQVDDKKLNSFESKLGKLKTMVAGFVSIYALKMLSNMVKQASDFTDEIAKQSEALGITTDAFQQMSYAFQINGASMQDFMASFRKLATSVGYAQEDIKTYTRLFEGLGLSMDTVNKYSNDTQGLFYKIVDALKAVPDKVKQTYLATQLLGRGAMRMIPAINKGADAFRDLAQEASDLGFIIDKEAIEKGVELHDTWTRFSIRMQILKTQTGLGLAPAFKVLFEKIVPKGVMIIRSLWDSIDKLAQAFGGWGKVLSAIGIYLAAVYWPFMLFVLGVLALVDILGALQGKASVFEDIFGKEAVEMLKSTAHWLEKIREFLVDIVAVGIEKIANVFKVLGSVGGKIGDFIAKGNADYMRAFAKQPSTAPANAITNSQTANKNVINQTNNIKSTDPEKAATLIQEKTKESFKELGWETP